MKLLRFLILAGGLLWGCTKMESSPWDIRVESQIVLPEIREGSDHGKEESGPYPDILNDQDNHIGKEDSTPSSDLPRDPKECDTEEEDLELMEEGMEELDTQHIDTQEEDAESPLLPRCGNEECERQLGENCSTCPQDCRCLNGHTCCEGTCTDTSKDKFNCGECGRGCPNGEECCNGKCTNLNRDPANCGKCGNSCPKGFGCCNGVCKNLKKDPNNCGKCGHKCAEGETCCLGTCVDLMSDRHNCGACGHDCGKDSDDALWGCCEGVCKNLLRDNDNCGDCGHKCINSPKIHEVCINGKCESLNPDFDHPEIPQPDY